MKSAPDNKNNQTYENFTNAPDTDATIALKRLRRVREKLTK